MCWKSECSKMLYVQDFGGFSLSICNQSIKDPVLKCRLAALLSAAVRRNLKKYYV